MREMGLYANLYSTLEITYFLGTAILFPRDSESEVIADPAKDDSQPDQQLSQILRQAEQYGVPNLWLDAYEGKEGGPSGHGGQ